MLTGGKFLFFVQDVVFIALLSEKNWCCYRFCQTGMAGMQTYQDLFTHAGEDHYLVAQNDSELSP